MPTLIWDFDGTLGYRTGGWSKACVDVLTHSGVASSVEIEDVRPHLQTGFPWQTPDNPHPEISTAAEWWEQLYPVFVSAFEALGVSRQQAQAVVAQVRQTYLDTDWQVFDDTRHTLARLSDAGWRHCLLSNHVPELPMILDELALTPVFDDIYVSAEIGYEKPHPKAFEPVLSDVADDTVVWMIGDSYHADVAGANTVGLPAILVRGTHPDARHCCDRLSDVPALLPEI